MPSPDLGSDHDRQLGADQHASPEIGSIVARYKEKVEPKHEGHQPDQVVVLVHRMTRLAIVIVTIVTILGVYNTWPPFLPYAQHDSVLYHPQGSQARLSVRLWWWRCPG